MPKTKLYLETTIFNFVFAEDSPEKRDDTLALFAEIRSGKYDAYTSEYALDELNDAPEEKRAKMVALIGQYGIAVIEKSDEALKVAKEYVSQGVIPQRYETDALHIAIASIAGIDIIVSLNFKHIVKHKTKTVVEAINLLRGYKKVAICAPSEVIDDENT
jgi:predicted nucleic acid-binding protein